MMTDAQARRLAVEAKERGKGGLASEMTLRDNFAAKAMQGELATMTETEGILVNMKDDGLAILAKHWYRIADAILKEREK